MFLIVNFLKCTALNRAREKKRADLLCLFISGVRKEKRNSNGELLLDILHKVISILIQMFIPTLVSISRIHFTNHINYIFFFFLNYFITSIDLNIKNKNQKLIPTFIHTNFITFT